MTGGDCHDTLMPFPVPVPGPIPLPLPIPASSGPTGILTGAVAWNMDNHPTKPEEDTTETRRDRKYADRNRQEEITEEIEGIISREGISPVCNLKYAFKSMLKMHLEHNCL